MIDELNQHLAVFRLCMCRDWCRCDDWCIRVHVFVCTLVFARLCLCPCHIQGSVQGRRSQVQHPPRGLPASRRVSVGVGVSMGV